MNAFVFFLFLIPILFGCSKENQVINNYKSVHDQQSSNVIITLTKKGNITAKIEAELMKKNNQNLKLELKNNVKVDLYDDDFNHKSIINSQYAIVDEKENKINAYDNVQVISNDGKQLKADSLLWDNNEDRIFTNSNLQFITADTDTLYGKGFESNIDLTDWIIFQPKGSINNE
tara:strand:- start:10587 stop:11108 length:522 start_codon:yes stop_codon:yes gene_type:complete